ncbi:MAG TPA: peptidyl-prolyl cis-trans isomerase [Holophagaceae bacterium]|nr:peptidyl-prolyl cis-trans isomerase [Holophagaceae bacterium]
MSRVSLALLLALGLPAQTPAPAKSAPKPKPHARKAKPAAKKAEASPVLARVGGEPITQADFDAVLAQLPQQQQLQIMMVQGGREEFIKRLAESKLLAVKARSLGLGDTPEFARTLARMKDDLLAREFLKSKSGELQKQMEIKDADVKAYYDAHPDKFKQPELVSVRHILVNVKRDPADKEGLSDADAQKKIADLQAQLKGGKDFAELAKTASDDPGSKENGGLYADADPSLWVPEFAKAAKEQAVGVVGDPIKTQFGYHLVKVEGRKPGRQIPFEEAKDKARQGAQQARQEQVWGDLMAELKKDFAVEILPPAPKAAAPRVVAPAPGKAAPAIKVVPAPAPKAAPAAIKVVPAPAPKASPAPEAKPAAAPEPKAAPAPASHPEPKPEQPAQGGEVKP